MIPEAASVLSQGMHTNPLHEAAFPLEDRRRRAFDRIFQSVLQGQMSKGRPSVALHSGRIVGVCGCFSPGTCQMSVGEKARILPILLGSAGLPGTGRILSWFGEWSKHDPAEAHWHLGPVAVLPEMQGKGVGTAMLEQFCQIAEGEKLSAYLETDKQQNVGFYEKFGFETREEGLVLGVKNWYMTRRARA